MPSREVYKIAFDTDAGALTENDLLAEIDFSRADICVLSVLVEEADTAAGDTLNIYLQSRGPTGLWQDRIAVAQFTGDMTLPKGYFYNLMKWAQLSSAEEGGELAPGSTGSHITAGTILHGPFPGRYMQTGEKPASGWRLVFVQVDATTQNAHFAGTVWIELDSPDRSG